MTTPWQRYQADLQRSGFVRDAAQARAVRRLDELQARVLAAQSAERSGLHGWWRRLRGVDPQPVRGLYLCGGVGRGKTYLMDAFFECIPVAAKRRQHFHRFMQAVHARLRALADREDPLAAVAGEWAEAVRVLCLDEFFVDDIGDAMILSRLLDGLLAGGVTLVATSNTHPDHLYYDGLQRARFLPAIELIKGHTEILEMGDGSDYRLAYLEHTDICHVPHDADAEAALSEHWAHLCPQPGRALEAPSLPVEGREIPTRAIGDGVVWFDFAALCKGPRSQLDYIAIARRFHTVILADVPVMGADQENPARRFIALVDEFYDRGVKLILSAAAPTDELYRGHRLAFEFERTASRLVAMRSRQYLAVAHRA